MISPRLRRAGSCVAIAVVAGRATAQTSAVPAAPPWRDEAAAVGTTARVLIIGAHPDDEDNALIAWLSLGRHVETAYLSLTRGENGVNLNARERETLLGMVRTAESLAERKRDGARQFFTRAYDFGHAKNDSAAYAVWPRDSLLRDVVTVMRAFRPHVVISLFAGDTADHDGQHEVAGQLARQGFMLAGDTARFPAQSSSSLGPWTIGALYQAVDSGSGPSVVRINVGEFDRNRGRSYAELGSEIRLLQRTQVQPPVPPVGALYRYLRRDSLRASADETVGSPPTSLFAGADTGWTRFAVLGPGIRGVIDTIVAATSAASGSQDTIIARLERVVRVSARARDSLRCADPAGLNCAGLLGDLAVSLATTRDRATRALLDASGIVIDATADREAVAVGDSVPMSISVYNGGTRPITVSRVDVTGRTSLGFVTNGAVTVPPDSVGRWSGALKMRDVTYPWWLPPGLVPGTFVFALKLNPFRPVNTLLIDGEDRVLSTSAQVTLRIGETYVTTRVGPVVARGDAGLRGDERRPVAGVPRISVILANAREYARAVVPFERLERVWVASSLSHADTVRVTIDLPAGLTTDSATRTVVLPPFSGRTVFYRVRGRWTPGEFGINVSVTPATGRAAANAQAGMRPVGVDSKGVTTGIVAFEYPHIPTQRYPRQATDSVQAIDLHVPPRLRVAFIRASRDEQVDTRVSEMGIETYAIDPSALGVADLSIYSTILIAPSAFLEVEALQVNAGAVRQFAERGGTVVVMYGRDELMIPGVLPYPVVFSDRKPFTALDPQIPIQFASPRSPLLDWPNKITPADFADWVSMRARELPAKVDPRYQTVVEMNDDLDRRANTGILAARVGKGMFIYTALSLDRQLVATNPGAARLLVNLLSAAAQPKP